LVYSRWRGPHCVIDQTSHIEGDGKVWMVDETRLVEKLQQAWSLLPAPIAGRDLGRNQSGARPMGVILVIGAGHRCCSNRTVQWRSPLAVDCGVDRHRGLS
jgi:hypothetical protein